MCVQNGLGINFLGFILKIIFGAKRNYEIYYVILYTNESTDPSIYFDRFKFLGHFSTLSKLILTELLFKT